MRPLPGLSACLSAGAMMAAHAQQPSPQSQTTFVSEVELVEVDVSVLDKNRLPVRGLTAADFTILEDGKRRPVVTFAAVDLPDAPSASAPWVRTVAPDVISNAVPDEGRLVVILFSGSIPLEQQRYARSIGAAIVNQLGPNDLGAVIYSSAFKQGAAPQNFTTDRRRLLAAVDQPAFGMTSPPDMTPLGLVEAPDVPSPGADPCNSRSLDSMANIAESLGSTPHRRRILFMIARTLSFQAFGACSLELKRARERLFRALESANVTVHVIDPSGLEYVDPKLRAALLQRQGNLEVLPERTGGRMVTNTNDQANLVPAIFDESRSYYLLAFERANSRNDNSFHTIDVRVLRRDVTIHARRGYYARAKTAAPSPSDRLFTALSGALPANGISLGVSTAPMAATGGDSAVAVTVAVCPASKMMHLDMLIAAFDAEGNPAATAKHELEIDDVNGDGRPSEIVSRLTLKPGIYEVRAAVRERGTDRAGSVYTYVDVPNFAQSALSLSGLLLSMQSASPTAQRIFRPTDQVTGLLTIHQAGTPRAIAVTLKIKDEADRVVISDATSLDADRLHGTPATADYRFRLPNAELRNGEYLLTVEAAAGGDIARREVRFSVR